MRKVAIFFLGLFLFCSCSGFYSVAFADETSNETGVIEDLQRDEFFDIASYPADTNDRSVKVIQVAESTSGNLFVYVYQPGGDLIDVSSINICQDSTDAAERHWYNYKLVKIDVQNTLGKYRVEGLTLRIGLLRYYDVSSIYRLPFDDEISGKVTGATLPNGNTTNEIAYEVARCYMAVTIDGKVTYDEQHTEVVTITDKYVGFVRYLNGFLFVSDSCDSFYVAFSTDHQIDDLYEADVQFVRQDWWREDSLFGTLIDKPERDPVTEFVTLSYSDIVQNDTWGIGGVKHIWNRIEPVSTFISNEDLLEDTKKALDGKQWVLRFYEGMYQEHPQRLGRIIDYEKVTEVTILRLFFREKDKTYNLGVIDNKQSGSLFPDNPNEIPGAFDRLSHQVLEFLKTYWWVIAIVVVLIALAVLSAIFQPVWKVVKMIFKVLWWVISAPARLVVLIANKIKERKG